MQKFFLSSEIDLPVVVKMYEGFSTIGSAYHLANLS